MHFKEKYQILENQKVLSPLHPPPPAGPGQCPDNNKHININIFGVSYKITIKSQAQVPYKVVPY